MSKATATTTPRSKGEAKTKASTKPVIKVDSSFTAAKWPTIDSAHQDIILKLLCSLLEPIGHHKTTYITPSKGKRSKKRKRVEEQKNNEEKINNEENPIPSPPSISKHITLGYNSTFRHLQETIKPSRHRIGGKDATLKTQSSEKNYTRKAETAKEGNQGPDSDTASQSEEAKPSKLAENLHLSTIFLTAQSPSTHLPYTPLPLLTALSSKNHPALAPTRLIPLSTGSEAKLCSALGIPRVGIIGVFEDAPGAKGLVDYVRENVEVVDVPWVKEAGKGEWLGTKIMFGEEGKEG
ncbi:putative RNA-processing protein [Venturia nashicola]|nr:putative RNA-processing protein [Venturia nashicola]